ncbi:MAG: hypothetical protein ACXABK_03125, partial [Candidatus Heimdallarchaeaceae archaeon]
MIKIKLKTLPLIFIILITPMIMFPIVQETQAIPPEFQAIIDGNEGHKIVVYEEETMTFTTSEWSHVLHGWIDLTPTEKEHLEPFMVDVLIDGVKIDLRSFIERDYSTGTLLFNIWFYQTFDAGYFTPGIYNWTVVWRDVTGIVAINSHPLIIFNAPHQLVVYQPDTMIITASERCYVSHGWTEVSQVEFSNLEPFNVQIFIDGIEIEGLYHVTEREQNTYNVNFYRYFDQNYFEPGIYNWTVVWSDITGIVWVQSHPLVILEDPHRLNFFNPNAPDVLPETLIISTSERCYIRHGFMWTPEQFGDEVFYEQVPYNVQLYIEDQEVELYQKFEIEYDELGNPLMYYLFFYKYFDANYFDPGFHKLTVVWSVASNPILENSHPLTVLNTPKRINVFSSEICHIATMERCYVQHGWKWTAEQFGNVDFYNNLPFDFRITIGGQEIDLYQRFVIEYDEIGNPLNYYLLYYKYFDGNYFSPDEYNLLAYWYDS